MSVVIEDRKKEEKKPSVVALRKKIEDNLHWVDGIHGYCDVGVQVIDKEKLFELLDEFSEATEDVS